MEFEIEECTVDTAKLRDLGGEKAGGQGTHVAGAPVGLPVDPGSEPELAGFQAAAAECVGFGDFAFEARLASLRDGAEAGENGLDAGFEGFRFLLFRIDIVL